jgi:uncharacterized membrane protein
LKTARYFLGIGILIAVCNAIVLSIILYFDSEAALRILSMIGACHVGGRLAFIGTGFEVGFTTIPIIVIIIFYNTAYLLIVYSIFVLLSENVSKFKFFKSIHDKVQKSKNIHNKWNLISIAVFIWIPLPMTGAVVGSLIAYLEGFQNRQVALVSVLSMWFGVISWTLLFNQMYGFLRSLHSYTTLLFTLLLLMLPFIVAFFQKFRKRKELD